MGPPVVPKHQVLGPGRLAILSVDTGFSTFRKKTYKWVGNQARIYPDSAFVGPACTPGLPLEAEVKRRAQKLKKSRENHENSLTGILGSAKIRFRIGGFE